MLRNQRLKGRRFSRCVKSPEKGKVNMKQDLLLKRFLSDDERYADLINGLGFNGKQIVSASDLSELDSQTGQYGKVSGKKENSSGKSKMRDLIRKVAFGINFTVIGIENQEEVHYLMPLRVMSYDSGEYQRQAAQIKKKVRAQKGITGAEYLSGFTKDSRLHPCVTFVLYYGEEWDGSRDLYGILEFSEIPSELRDLVSNYNINVIEIRKLQNTDIFQTDLKQVFDFIRFSEDKQKLRKLVENDAAYQNMDEDAYDVAVAFSHAKELLEVKKNYEKDGEVNMCKAIKEMMADERQEGRKEGIKVLIETCQEFGRTREEIFEKVKTKFVLSDEETEGYLLKYWAV